MPGFWPLFSFFSPLVLESNIACAPTQGCHWLWGTQSHSVFPTKGLLSSCALLLSPQHLVPSLGIYSRNIICCRIMALSLKSSANGHSNKHNDDFQKVLLFGGSGCCPVKFPPTTWISVEATGYNRQKHDMRFTSMNSGTQLPLAAPQEN